MLHQLQLLLLLLLLLLQECPATLSGQQRCQACACSAAGLCSSGCTCGCYNSDTTEQDGVGGLAESGQFSSCMNCAVNMNS
jgi:hypothetical protein